MSVGGGLEAGCSSQRRENTRLQFFENLKKPVLRPSLRRQSGRNADVPNARMALWEGGEAAA